MPTPEWKKHLPKAGSLKKRLVDNILNENSTRRFGPAGSSASTYGLTKPGSPMGDPPRDNEWGPQDIPQQPRAKG